MLAIAGTLANSVLVANCTTDYGAALNSFAYLWIGIYAGQFFEQRAARFQAAVLVVASGVALWLSGLPGMVTAWALVAGSSVLATEALARLNSRAAHPAGHRPAHRAAQPLRLRRRGRADALGRRPRRTCRSRSR